MSQVVPSKRLSSTAFLTYFVVKGYVPKRTPKEIRDLIVLFTYAKGDYSGTFLPNIAGWQMQINISFAESKINKIVNAQMSKNNIPVYLPYVVNQKLTVKQLKQEVLKMNGIDAALHDEYYLWVWRKFIWNTDDKRNTKKTSPDVNDNMKMKQMYQMGGKGYESISDRKTLRRKLNAGEKCILSKNIPEHREQGKLYGWEMRGKYYTREELLKLWGGKDLSVDDISDPDDFGLGWAYSSHYSTWYPTKYH